VRWGKTEIVTPTDRFAPRDFLTVVDNEFLAVTGTRGVVQAGAYAVDGVWVPWLTPSRMPLIDQRWTVVPEFATPFPLKDAGSVIPNGSQFGLRFSRTGGTVDFSLSAFDGFNHLPDINIIAPADVPLAIQRVYPQLRTYGGDAAIPTKLVTIKAEGAYFTSSTVGSDEYVLYVVQLERQTGEWVFVGGYVGEVITEHRAPLTFSLERGLAKSIVGRASYTVDPNRTVAFETAVRQTGRGIYVKGEYSQAYRDHWRATVTGVIIGGSEDDFLGQYRRNSHVMGSVRYSF